jgi:hypothetical protein
MMCRGPDVPMQVRRIARQIEVTDEWLADVDVPGFYVLLARRSIDDVLETVRNDLTDDEPAPSA